MDFRGLVPSLGAILGPNLGCNRSLLIVVAKVDYPIDCPIYYYRGSYLNSLRR